MSKDVISGLHFIYTKDSFVLDDVRANLKSNNKWTKMFLNNKYHGLYELGFLESSKGLESSALFLYRLSEYFIKFLSRLPELEVAREQTKLELDKDQVEYLISLVPFAIGSEYVNEYWIKEQIIQMNNVFFEQMSQYEGSVQMYLQEKSQNLHVAQRIYFHLVENEEEKDHPFAFLVTYASKDNYGRILHMPLKNALVEYQKDREQLLKLLSCLNNVAQKNYLIAEYMNSGDIYHPIRLSVKEAYYLLKSVPEIEKSGITCRVPNWWKKHYSSVSAKVSVGDKKQSLFGFDTLLNLQPNLIVNGNVLTKSEISQLLKAEEGLAWLKGQWVEVNHAKLKQLLEQMETYDGSISLKEALTRTYLSDDEETDSEIEITNGKWLNTLMAQLKNPSKIKNKSKPRYLNAKLRPYQMSGYNWLNQMSDLGFGACLADDMGLGKTIQVISYLEKMIESKKGSRVLLIVPASLLGNWSKEIDKFAAKLPYYILHGKGAPLLSKEFQTQTAFLTITTYGMATRLEILQKINWDCIILDEAQAIKNPGTKQTRIIKKIPSRMKIAMTGTPIENDLSNLWSLFDFLNKGLLGSANEFKEFTKNMPSTPESMAKLKAMVSPFILRRLKTDKSIISDLPDKIEIIDHVDLSKRQIVLYRREVAKAEEKLEQLEGFERRGLVLALLTKLKQICNHPDQFVKDDNYNAKDSGKFQILKELCQTIYEKRERVLVFTQYKELCGPLANYLEMIFNRKGFIIHGGISPKKRTEIVDKFNDPNHYVPFIILSLKAAGTGLNLVSANHVIHFDRWWNPAVENQASDRAYRIGQTKEVFVHKLVSNGTIEEKIDQLIQSKQELANSVLAASQESWITELSNDELLKLLRLDL